MLAIKVSLTPILLNYSIILWEIFLSLDKKTIEPPPPLQTIFEASDPFCFAISIILSISGVVIFKSFFKKSWWSFMSLEILSIFKEGFSNSFFAFKGFLKFTTGAEYYGHFIEDEREGYGIQIDPNGETYEG